MSFWSPGRPFGAQDVFWVVFGSVCHSLNIIVKCSLSKNQNCVMFIKTVQYYYSTNSTQFVWPLSEHCTIFVAKSICIIYIPLECGVHIDQILNIFSLVCSSVKYYYERRDWETESETESYWVWVTIIVYVYWIRIRILNTYTYTYTEYVYVYWIRIRIHIQD